LWHLLNATALFSRHATDITATEISAVHFTAISTAHEIVAMRTVFKKTRNIFPMFLVCLYAEILATFGRNTCSRVVSVLDSGAEGAGFRSLSGNSLRQIVHTHCASVHQAAKLVAALLRVAGVTAGLPESNSSLPPGL